MPYPSITRRRLGLIAGATLAAPHIARAADPVRLRVSLDTAPSHMRNVSFTDYLKQVEDGSGGRIKTELFSAGALFSDANVIKALVQGQVEMAAPGTWTMTGFIPDFDFINLPMLYGQPLEDARRAVDGKTGQSLNAQLRSRLKMVVLGPWLELGAQHWYSATKPIKDFSDLKGMKIRNAGGAAMAWRERFFEAIPNTTAWPDVPLALSQGTFDGVISTNESCSSSKLWESGLKSSIQDSQNVNNYVPMISEKFLTSLPNDLQALIVDTWTKNIPGYRKNMLAAQVRALNTLKEHGMQVIEANPAEIVANRQKMVVKQDQLIADLKISPSITPLLHEDLGSIS